MTPPPRHGGCFCFCDVEEEKDAVLVDDVIAADNGDDDDVVVDDSDRDRNELYSRVNCSLGPLG